MEAQIQHTGFPSNFEYLQLNDYYCKSQTIVKQSISYSKPDTQLT